MNALPLWKQAMLGAYYHGTRPYRWWSGRAAGKAGKAPAMVLYYHRVADEAPNDWTISNEMFARQIEWLRLNFDMVSLEEAQRRIRHRESFRPSVSITFDDGYAENCEQALPLLVKERIPCTYFVSTKYVLEGRPFPHDVAAGHPLPTNTVEQLRALADAGVEIGAHTRTHADLGRIQDPKRLTDEIVTARHELQETVGCRIRYFAFPFGLHKNLSAEAFEIARRARYDAVCSAYGGYNVPGDDPFHLQRIHADADMIRLMNWVTVDPRKRATVQRYRYEQPAPNKPAGALTS